MKIELTPQQRQIVNQATDILRWQMVHPDTRIACPGDAVQYLQLKLADEQQQVFGVIFLNSKHRVIADRVLFRGTITHCSVYTREIVKEVLGHSATTVILYSNDPEVGNGDIGERMIRETRTIRDALALIDVSVIDRLLVSGLDAHSFAQKGLL